MSATVVPFPLIKRRGFALRHAAQMAAYSPEGAESYLQAQLKRQQRTMQRRGIEPDRIDAELTALEVALRAEFWALKQHGGAA